MREGFLWGAATSAHQTEGENTTSDWWQFEQRGLAFIREPSGRACDSWHRWPEDMDLLAAAGFTDYRFSVEWARVEPSPGAFSQPALDHYAAMVRGAIERGLRPLVTLHHFTSPVWFEWTSDDAVGLFTRYVATVAPLLDGVRHVCTINEPNLLALLPELLSWKDSDGTPGHPEPDPAMADVVIACHRAARTLLRDRAPEALVGWSIACQAFTPVPGAEELCARIAYPRETRFLEVSRDDDWVGVQCYTRTRVGPDGVLPPQPPLTLTGWEVAPDALGTAIRTASQVAQVPVVVTENGIATADDDERIAYTEAALAAMRAAIDDGVDVRGYIHWSLLDNYEWGRWAPTFGLVAVDRKTFERTPKPSLRWLGARLRSGDPVAP